MLGCRLGVSLTTITPVPSRELAFHLSRSHARQRDYDKDHLGFPLRAKRKGGTAAPPKPQKAKQRKAGTFTPLVLGLVCLASPPVPWASTHGLYCSTSHSIWRAQLESVSGTSSAIPELDSVVLWAGHIS